MRAHDNSIEAAAVLRSSPARAFERGAAYPDAVSDAPRLTEEQTARVVAIAMDLARAGDTDQLAGFLDHDLPVDVLDADATAC